MQEEGQNQDRYSSQIYKTMSPHSLVGSELQGREELADILGHGRKCEEWEQTISPFTMSCLS